jgi:hypothetical protein
VSSRRVLSKPVFPYTRRLSKSAPRPVRSGDFFQFVAPAEAGANPKPDTASDGDEPQLLLGRREWGCDDGKRMAIASHPPLVEVGAEAGAVAA